MKSIRGAPTESLLTPFEIVAIPQSDRGKRVKQREYLPEGRIPVIDQGQSFVGGYTNNDEYKFAGELPVILFGDHTRAVKLLDKPFAVGADGIKIFRPAEGVRPKYLYYWMKAAPIPNRGYGRHYQYLRQLALHVPELEQQDQIVAEIEKQFSRLDEAVANLKRVKANLRRYKAAVLNAAIQGCLIPTEAELASKERRSYETGEELLLRILHTRRASWTGRGKYKEPEPARLDRQYQLPDGWTWTNLGQISTSVKDGPHFSPKYSTHGVPFISGGNVRPEGIDFSSTKFISPELHAELSKRCKPECGDLLYTKGGTTGIARINTETRDFNVWVHVAVLKLTKDVHPFYIQHALNSKHCYAQSQEYTHGVGNQDLGLTRMIWITIPLPPRAEQDRIVAEVDRRLSVAREIEADVDANLVRGNALRNTTLLRAFSEQ